MGMVPTAFDPTVHSLLQAVEMDPMDNFHLEPGNQDFDHLVPMARQVFDPDRLDYSGNHLYSNVTLIFLMRLK